VGGQGLRRVRARLLLALETGHVKFGEY
jgi:hypothetical protein